MVFVAPTPAPAALPPARARRRAPRAGRSVTGLLVLLHGHGDDPAGLATLAQRLDPDGRLQRVVPSGSHRTPTGPAWLPADEAATTSDDVELALAGLGRALATTGVLTPSDDGPGHGLVLAGFSQGAAVALAYALAPRRGASADWPRPDHVLGFGSFLLPPDVAAYDPAAATGTRWWLGHGDDDPVVPVQRGRAAARWLGRHDLDVHLCETAGGHAITEDQVADARRWLGA